MSTSKNIGDRGTCRNFRTKLAEHIAAMLPLAAGQERHVDVLHDRWCALLSGSAPCDCEPSIVTGPLADAKYGTGADQ